MEIKGIGFEYVEKGHSYYLDGKKMTGVTTVLGIISKPQLIGWAARMATEYVANNKERLEEEFEQVLEEAKNAHVKVRDGRAEEGTDTHSCIEDYINLCIQTNEGKPYEVSGKKETEQFSKWAIENVGKFLGSEQKFYSEKLFVAGTADFTFERKDGKRFLGDVKTYKKIWDNIPFAQCAAYSMMAEEMGQEPYYGYCIVNLPPQGELECLWNLDVEADKQAFLSALNLYRFIKKF